MSLWFTHACAARCMWFSDLRQRCGAELWRAGLGSCGSAGPGWCQGTLGGHRIVKVLEVAGARALGFAVGSSRSAGVGWPGRGSVRGTPPQASWAQEGHGGSSDCPSPSLQAARLEEMASREPLKPASRWKPDGWPAGLGPAFQPGQLAQPTPGCVARVEAGSGAGSGAKSCVGYRVGSGLLMVPGSELVRIASGAT